MIKNHKLINHLKLLAIACTLSACGGGGGGNDLHFNSTLNANVIGLEETSGLFLKVNDKEIEPINKPGTAALASDLPVGNSFNVSIQKQPEDFQWCSLQNNAGVISENGNMVDVTCTTSGVLVSTIASGVFNVTRSMVMDQAGNLYVSDNDYVVRKISPDGTIDLYTGRPGIAGTTDGIKGTATISQNLGGMAIDKDGIIYFTDQGGLIRKIEKDGRISDYFTMSRDRSDFFNVGGRNTSLKGLAFDSAGDLYVADDGQRVVYKIKKSDKTISIFAGTPYSAGQVYAIANPVPKDGAVGVGYLNGMWGLAIDKDDNLHVTDVTHKYRKIDRAGVISTPATFDLPGGTTIRQVTVDKYKNIYLSGITPSINPPLTSAPIIKLTPNGKISMLAGKSGTLAGYADGVNSEFMLSNEVRGLILDQDGHLIISDANNRAIRRMIPAAP